MPLPLSAQNWLLGELFLLRGWLISPHFRRYNSIQAPQEVCIQLWSREFEWSPRVYWFKECHQDQLQGRRGGTGGPGAHGWANPDHAKTFVFSKGWELALSVKATLLRSCLQPSSPPPKKKCQPDLFSHQLLRCHCNWTWREKSGGWARGVGISGEHSERQCLSSQIASFTKNKWERGKMEACGLFSSQTFRIEAGHTHACSYGTKLRATMGVRVGKPGPEPPSSF